MLVQLQSLSQARQDTLSAYQRYGIQDNPITVTHA